MTAYYCTVEAYHFGISIQMQFFSSQNYLLQIGSMHIILFTVFILFGGNTVKIVTKRGEFTRSWIFRKYYILSSHPKTLPHQTLIDPDETIKQQTGSEIWTQL